jgi:urease accessory protein
MTSFSPSDPAVGQPLIERKAQSRAKRQLELQFASDANGRTYIERQFAAYPFHVCRALYHDTACEGLATLYIQSCSGGLYEDDRLDITFEAKTAAAAHITTQASTVVHSMLAGSAAQHTSIRAGRQSYLEYLPDPQILFPHSRLNSTIHVALAGDAVVLVSDSFLTHDPTGAECAFTSYLSEIEIEDDAGRRLAIDRMQLDGSVLQPRYPGIMGTFVAQGTLIAAGIGSIPKTILADLAHLSRDNRVAAIGLSELPKSSGIIVRIIASDGATLRREMQGAWSAIRHLLKGCRSPHERK